MLQYERGKATLIEIGIVWTLAGLLTGVFLLARLGWTGEPVNIQHVQDHQVE